MAFKNLEQRFNENVNKLYAGATLKFDNGIASNGKADAPLITRAPGKGYWTKYEDRALPIQSTIQDVKRLTLFQLSKPGLLFLAKQQLLQTGNTFQHTRLINPVFVVANAVPFLHVKRNLRPLGELIGKTDTSYENVKKIGQVQEETYNRLKNWKQPQFIRAFVDINYVKGQSKTSSKIVSNLLGKLKSKALSIISPISALNPLQNRNIGDKGWQESRPELAPDSIVSVVAAANRAYQAYTVDDEKLSFIRYFDSKGISGIAQFKDVNGQPRSGIAKRAGDTEVPGVLPFISTGKISYIKDPSNKERSSARSNTQEAYKPINHKFEDAIVVSFAMGKDAPIQFRAFIKDLNQTATPEYKSYQYIGRMEKFINYVGVQREISFKLGIVAFGPSELEAVWRRINYLTGLVFPYGFNKGLMQPNITRLTIGNVYVDQPGYVTLLSTNFNELGESWEIGVGKQVPIAAQMDIKFTIIEKSTKIADSPFYGITEKMERFSEQIPIPDPRINRLDPTKAPPVQSNKILVDSRKPITTVDRSLVNEDPFNIFTRGINVDRPNITIPPPNITFGK